MKTKIVAIMGKAGAGKDALLHSIMANKDSWFCQEIVSCTTRPMREGEIEGVNYYFLTEDQFEESIMLGGMIEYTEFRGWHYGTHREALQNDKINIGVFNPAGVLTLLNDPNFDVYVIMVNVKDKTRLMRQLQREENPDCYEIARRFQTDEKDFDDFYNDIFNNHYNSYLAVLNNDKDADLNYLGCQAIDHLKRWMVTDSWTEEDRKIILKY